MQLRMLTSLTLSPHPPTVCCRLAMFGGPVAVDFFLLLTAMLALYQLLPALEGSGGSGSSGKADAQPSTWAVVARYWRRRALRLLPAYAVVNLLALLALGPHEGVSPEVALARSFAFPNCRTGLWRNALYITNFNVHEGCGEERRGALDQQPKGGGGGGRCAGAAGRGPPVCSPQACLPPHNCA